MTDKDLHKLSREDLLKLMLAQSREVTRQKTLISELEESKAQDAACIDRLKGKLDEKDEAIERLKGRLNEKDALLEKLKQRLDNKDALLQKQQEMLEGMEPPAPKTDGRGVQLEEENGSLRQQLAELNEKLGEQNVLLEQKNAELRQAHEALETASAEDENDALGDLDLLLDEFNEKNTRLLDQLKAKEAQIEVLCRQASERESFENEFHEQMTALRESLSQRIAAPADTEAINAALSEQVQRLRESLAAGSGQPDALLQERLKEKELQVRELSSKLEQRDNEIRELWSKIWSLVAPKS